MSGMEYASRVSVFRDRIAQVVSKSNLNHSQFAKSIGVDRSTLSQLLSENDLRLPRADTLASIAEHCNVSVDWLLGITDTGSPNTQLLTGPLELEQYCESNLETRLIQWYIESQHYKVRYIPSTLPDFMKLEQVVACEFRRYGMGKIDQSIRESQFLLAQLRNGKSEMEACMSLQDLRSFAYAQGVWGDVPVAVRQQQLRHMIRLNQELYPRFRWYLFDGRIMYTAAFSIFGPLRAVVFLGQHFLVLNSAKHVRLLTRRFEDLIRHAIVHPHDINATLKQLLDEIDVNEQ
jgi:transcriptional regulator with XRE-family HTH domain